MKKYLVIERKNDWSNEWVSVYDTLEEANDNAKRTWEHLSDYDKKHQNVSVGIVTEDDLCEWAYDDETGEVNDWTAYDKYKTTTECFDSEIDG